MWKNNWLTHIKTYGNKALLCRFVLFFCVGGVGVCVYRLCFLLLIFSFTRLSFFIFPLFSMPFSPYDTNHLCFMNMWKIISACPIILKISSMEECHVYFEPQCNYMDLWQNTTAFMVTRMKYTIYWIMSNLEFEVLCRDTVSSFSFLIVLMDTAVLAWSDWYMQQIIFTNFWCDIW